MESERKALLANAKILFESNHREGVNYDFTCPSPENYPHQWLWDSSFHAIVLSGFDPERAKREVNTLLAKQKENGFISCVSIWDKRHPLEELFYITKITQPPVAPLAVEKIYERTADKVFVKKTYPSLKKFMRWFSENRDKNENGLIEIIHPWEDGDDGNPAFDKQMGFKNPKPNTLEYFYSLFRVLGKYTLLGWDEEKIYESGVFRAETNLFNSIYAKSLISMANLANVLGESDDVQIFIEKYKQTRNALINLCWNEKDKIFYDLDRNGKQICIKTTSSLMPLILPDIPKSIFKPLVEKHLLNAKEFWSTYPITSISQDEATFNPGNGFDLWRGPMWINTNWFLANALSQHGYKDKALELTKKTVDAVKKFGFREFYNPHTGEGYGQKSFGWSTLVVEM